MWHKLGAILAVGPAPICANPIRPLPFLEDVTQLHGMCTNLQIAHLPRLEKKLFEIGIMSDLPKTTFVFTFNDLS